ncbi:MAG: hypothetical protein QOH24_1652 [Verrucomicrobiota bacterium]|jgi:hypothetical protein
MRDVSASFDMTGGVQVMKLSKGKANPQLAWEFGTKAEEIGTDRVRCTPLSSESRRRRGTSRGFD